jgi:hypothetical protein
MSASIESKRKLRAIRRLSASFPDRTAEERLKQIEGIASGKLEPKLVRHQTSPDLMERLAAGQASRSNRTATTRTEKEAEDKKKADEAAHEEKKRKAKATRNRKEEGGHDRSE